MYEMVKKTLTKICKMNKGMTMTSFSYAALMSSARTTIRMES